MGMVGWWDGGALGRSGRWGDGSGLMEMVDKGLVCI